MFFIILKYFFPSGKQNSRKCEAESTDRPLFRHISSASRKLSAENFTKTN